jgi:predicted DNA-binding transcriptional regulator YafY
MPRKIDPDQTYGEKVIRLFAQLLFSNRPHTLTELADAMNCSKQTISRILDKIEMSMGINLERTKRGKEAVYAVKNRKPPPGQYLSKFEMDVMWMCRAFAKRLVGEDLFAELEQSLYKAQTLVKSDSVPAMDNFACYIPGTIDYTPHRDTIRSLMEAMNQSRVCKVAYKAAESERFKSFHIKPLKIFTYKDTLYLHAQRAKDPWQKKWVEPEFNPLLAIHRFKKVEIAEGKAPFEKPKTDGFEAAFNQSFGIIKDESFTVEAEFTGWAAVRITERTWSPDQVITKTGDTVTLKFTASSRPEVLSWILSFGENGRLLRPDWLVDEVAQKIEAMTKSYTGTTKRQKHAMKVL